MNEADEKFAVSARNCPMCGTELDNELYCSKCEHTIKLSKRNSGRRFSASIILFAALLTILLAYSAWRFFMSAPVQVNGYIEVEMGVDDNLVYVLTDDYKEYSEKIVTLREMRSYRLELEREKTKILGDLAEERRIERLMLNLNNIVQELMDTLKRQEHASPSNPDVQETK